VQDLFFKHAFGSTHQLLLKVVSCTMQGSVAALQTIRCLPDDQRCTAPARKTSSSVFFW